MIESRTLVEWFDTLQGDGGSSCRYVASLGVVGGIGAGTFGFHVLHLLTQSEGLYTRVLSTVIPMCLAAVLLMTTVRAHRRREANVVVRIGAWCFVCAVVLVAMGVVSISYQRINGVVMTDVRFVLVNHATVGAILGALIGSYDGERRRREGDLHAEHERTRQLSNRLTILNRVFRHDIRNAVNVILGHANHIEEERVDCMQATAKIEEKAHELQEMSDCARRFERLLDREVAATKPIDIAPPLRAKASAFDSEGVVVESTIPESVAVRSSPLIEEAIDELLSNAIEHNDAPTPRLTITVQATESDDGESDTVTIEIRDNGPGIPEHELNVLERGHETELRHSSGLGLWFVHWVVDASNGWVTFDQNRPRGSVVEVHIPSAKTAATERTHDESRLDTTVGATPSRTSQRDESIATDRC
jgi:signal transduction histidine kinase